MSNTLTTIGHGDASVPFDLSLAARVGPEIDQMYAKASTLQAKMHDRMRDFAGDVKSEYRTWIVTEWTATIAAIVFLPASRAAPYRCREPFMSTAENRSE